ncbi:MAG TPA: NAD(P)-dependent oxidoreductase [Propionibacterium sp.]|nr:NAD(P)-dependent oxidoreductase [Propionibacterium sp.]
MGMVGLGVMGSAILERLVATGRRVRAFDVDPEAVARAVDLGATAAGSPAEAAADGVVILSLPSAAIVEAAAFGADGAATGPDATLVVDMSSIDPGATRRLADRASAAGHAWVDAPLSGGAPGALAGRLTLMMGGEESAVESARAVLADVAARMTHCGPSGAGQTVKLLNQVIVGTAMNSLAEVAALVRAHELDPEIVRDALSGGRADSPLLQEFFVKFAVADPTVTGRIANMIKDLDGALEAARGVGVPLPLTAASAEVHRWLRSRGLDAADSAALVAYYDTDVSDAGYWLS